MVMTWTYFVYLSTLSLTRRSIHCIFDLKQKNNYKRNMWSKHIKGWKEYAIYYDKTQPAHFWGRPLFQATRHHLTVKWWKRRLNYDAYLLFVELLCCFSCPVFGRIEEIVICIFLWFCSKMLCGLKLWFSDSYFLLCIYCCSMSETCKHCCHVCFNGSPAVACVHMKYCQNL